MMRYLLKQPYLTDTQPVGKPYSNYHYNHTSYPMLSYDYVKTLVTLNEPSNLYPFCYGKQHSFTSTFFIHNANIGTLRNLLKISFNFIADLIHFFY